MQRFFLLMKSFFVHKKRSYGVQELKRKSIEKELIKGVYEKEIEKVP